MMWSFSDFNENLALIDDNGVTLSYKTLRDESEKIAANIKKRCLVFILFVNEIGAIVGCAGFLNAKIVPALLNKHTDRALLENLLNAYRPEFFLWLPECMIDVNTVDKEGLIDDAKSEFWRRGHELVKNKYAFQDIQAVNKFTSFCLLAANKDNVKLSKHDDNLIICVQVPEISRDLMNFRDNSGYFLEYDCDNISEIKDLLDDKKCQTVAYLGSLNDDLINLVKSGIKGVDRIVPFGKTMDFDLIWDGYNLFSELTRTVKVE